MTDPDQVAELKAFAIEMSRDPAEGLTARQRALMACIVIPQTIQQWMVDAGAVEPLLDSIEKTILAAEKYARGETSEKITKLRVQIAKLGNRASKAEEYIRAGAPTTAIQALYGEFDQDA